MSKLISLCAALCLTICGLNACAPSLEEQMSTPAIAPMDWVKRDARFYKRYAGQMETFARAFDDTASIASNGSDEWQDSPLGNVTDEAMLKVGAISLIYGLNGYEENPRLGAIALETYIRQNPTTITVRNDMGILYLTGAGGRQDFRMAERQFLAAAPRSSEALFNLAIMHYNGFGVPVDYVEVHKWLTLASTCTTQVSAGYKKAAPALKKIAATLSPAQIDQSIAEVTQWLSQNVTPFDRNPFCNKENATEIRAMLRAEANARREAERNQHIAERAERDRKSAQRREDYERRRSRRNRR